MAELCRLLDRLIFSASAACFVVVSQACYAQTGTSLHTILRDLDERMTTVGEVSGKIGDFEASVDKARLAVAKLLATGDREKLLTERDSGGKTPLIAAAAAGYSDIVAEILLAPEAKSRIEDVDSRGLTAWDRANFGWYQAAWVCNPGIMKNPMTFVPVFVIRPYYKQEISPYRETRDMLEESGASANMDRAKQAWLKICKYRLSETAEKVQSSEDLLLTVLEQGDRTLEILFPGINETVQ